MSEAVRVLRPGGRLLVADISATGAYAGRLRELGMEDVRRRPLGGDRDRDDGLLGGSRPGRRGR